MSSNVLESVFSAFGIDEAQAQHFGNGHINDTFIVTKNGKKMVLQRLNTDVFKNGTGVMENIVNVTEYLAEKIKENGGNPDRETLHFERAKDGKPYFIAENGNLYRMYTFVDKAYTLEKATPEQMTDAACTLGRFYKMLASYPAETLNVAIPKFHDTRNYFNRFLEAVKNDVAARKASCKEEIEFVLSHEHLCDILNNGLAEGSIPLRVTHNDTKLNNILFDEESGRGMCVIDLDTVMPGSLLYDFGDAMRFGAASGPEDEQDLSKIWFDLDMFDAFTKGFATEMKACMTKGEVENLVNSCKILTFECGVRFLEDHLKGDTYFKIHREGHNLDRARTQFKLVADMEKKTAEMNAVVAKYFN